MLLVLSLLCAADVCIADVSIVCWLFDGLVVVLAVVVVLVVVVGMWRMPRNSQEWLGEW